MTHYENGFITRENKNYAYDGQFWVGNEVDLGIQFISQPEGYIEPNVTSSAQPAGVQGVEMDYVYQYKDHLGNIRLSYKDSNNDGSVDSSEIIEENNYYPFGLEHKGYNNVVNGQHYPYGYNGKEENDELGLAWLDFGARNYDASLGRWMNLDPLADNYTKYSPYSYTANNPIYFVDPDGKFILPASFRKKYKRLTQYLKNGIQEIANNKKIANALKKYGQFTEADIKRGLKWDSGPEINITKLSGAYGEFTPGIGSSILNIDVDLVDALEKAKGKDRDYLLFLVAVTILHEYVHYGDDQDGIDYTGAVGSGEEGNAFEITAYGKVIGKTEAKDLLKKYLEEKKKEETENKKKSEGFNNLINNLNNLEEGKYVWDGESWVRE